MNKNVVLATLSKYAQNGNRICYQGKNRKGKNTIKILWWGHGRTLKKDKNSANIVQNDWDKKGGHFKKRAKKLIEVNQKLEVFNFNKNAPGKKKWNSVKTIEID